MINIHPSAPIKQTLLTCCKLGFNLLIYTAVHVWYVYALYIGLGPVINPPLYGEHYVIFIDREAREIICLVASVLLSVCLFVGTLLPENAMTHEIQSKSSVCLSVIKERSRSKSCAQWSGAFNGLYFYLQLKCTQHLELVILVFLQR